VPIDARNSAKLYNLFFTNFNNFNNSLTSLILVGLPNFAIVFDRAVQWGIYHKTAFLHILSVVKQHSSVHPPEQVPLYQTPLWTSIKRWIPVLLAATLHYQNFSLY
jgi:hypothetical protein